MPNVAVKPVALFCQMLHAHNSPLAGTIVRIGIHAAISKLHFYKVVTRFIGFNA